MGVCFVSVSGGTLASVSYIPVNLTVLVFYTHPMMTLLVVSAMERRRPGVAELTAVSLALLGVGLAMQVSFEKLNGVGVAFALLAAVGATTTFIVAARALPELGTKLMSWYACSVAFAGGAALTLGFDAVAIPDTAFGIGLIAIIMAIFAIAVIAMFVGVKLIGPVRAATLLCLEPVTAIFVAVSGARRTPENGPMDRGGPGGCGDARRRPPAGSLRIPNPGIFRGFPVLRPRPRPSPAKPTIL